MIHSNLASNHTDIRFSTILQENKNKKKKEQEKYLRRIQLQIGHPSLLLLLFFKSTESPKE